MCTVFKVSMKWKFTLDFYGCIFTRTVEIMNNGFYSSFVCRSVLDVPYVLSNLSGDVTRWKKLWKLCISLDWFDEIASNLVDLSPFSTRATFFSAKRLFLLSCELSTGHDNRFVSRFLSKHGLFHFRFVTKLCPPCDVITQIT